MVMTNKLLFNEEEQIYQPHSASLVLAMPSSPPPFQKPDTTFTLIYRPLQ